MSDGERMKERRDLAHRCMTWKCKQRERRRRRTGDSHRVHERRRLWTNVSNRERERKRRQYHEQLDCNFETLRGHSNLETHLTLSLSPANVLLTVTFDLKETTKEKNKWMKTIELTHTCCVVVVVRCNRSMCRGDDHLSKAYYIRTSSSSNWTQNLKDNTKEREYVPN